MLDSELSDIQSQIDNSRNPEGEGLFDLGEYMFGYGFVAIQRYITSTYKQTFLTGMDRFKQGHQLKNGIFLMEALNAGANYWKHEPEWTFNLNVDSMANDDGLTPIAVDWSGEKLEKHSKKTYDLTSKITAYREYTLSNLLYELLKDISYEGELSFSPFLPFIEQWRNKADASL